MPGMCDKFNTNIQRDAPQNGSAFFSECSMNNRKGCVVGQLHRSCNVTTQEASMNLAQISVLKRIHRKEDNKAKAGKFKSFTFPLTNTKILLMRLDNDSRSHSCQCSNVTRKWI